MAIQNVTVTFDTQTKLISLSGDDILHKEGKAFVLKTNSITGYRFQLTYPAAFLSAPIQWLSTDGKSPIAMPFPGNIEVEDDQTALLTLDLSQLTSSEGFPFHMLVMYEGKIYYHDPVLLNEEDDDPGDGG
jgi:hypothetical protein